MILVTSAYGKVGRITIEKLLENNIEVCALDITPETENLKKFGVKDVIVGDMSDINICRKAVEKCDKIYFIPPLENEPTLCINMINATKSIGNSQFVYHSVLHTQKSSLIHHKAKGLAEEYLIDSDMNFTILNPTCYMFDINLPYLVEKKEWPCFWPNKTSYVDPDDVAEVALQVLTEDNHWHASYELVGSEVLNADEVMSIFKDVTGIIADIKYISPEEYFALSNKKISDYTEKAIRHLHAAYSQLGSKGNPNILTWLLNRKPTTMAEYISREYVKLQKTDEI
ncbi:MAG: SDR family oxidoreductase [Eubacteriales bacterium]